MRGYTYIFEHKTLKYLKPNTHEYVPAILIVKTTQLKDIKGTLITIAGKANPLLLKKQLLQILVRISSNGLKCMITNVFQLMKMFVKV